MTKVKCTVNNCEYWRSGQMCVAPEIEVKDDTSHDSDRFSQPYSTDEMEVSAEFDRPLLYNTTAHASSQTYCKTMKPKRAK
jgi:hypothetical protein